MESGIYSWMWITRVILSTKHFKHILPYFYTSFAVALIILGKHQKCKCHTVVTSFFDLIRDPNHPRFINSIGILISTVITLQCATPCDSHILRYELSLTCSLGCKWDEWKHLIKGIFADIFQKQEQ